MNRVRRMTALMLVAGLAACGPDQEGPEGAEAEGEGGEVPGGVQPEALSDWSVRLVEQGQDQRGFQMIDRESGFEVTTGPAGVAWRPVDLVEQGDFTASATFTEVGSPEGHREGYGILVGGKHLDSPDLEYTYFLVRGDGRYLVKRREGTSTIEITNWREAEGLQAASGGAEATNRLSVRVQGDSVRFAVNDAVVETLPADRVEPWGVAGIRVNHRLDVRVADWQVTGPNVGQAGGG